MVTSEVCRPGGNPIELVWSLTNRHGNFKSDLSIVGESMRLPSVKKFRVGYKIAAAVSMLFWS
jgi:hypothetical protein